MDQVKVLGHINPDTDATCSAIVYAWYLKEHMAMNAKPVLAGEPNREALYVLKRFNVEQPEITSELVEGEKVVLVDTNNTEELVKGYDKAEIIEIVDHHKLVGGLTTAAPIKITMRPVACIGTLLFQIFNENGVKGIPANIAGLMVSSILSDTLKFTSPTTTDDDKKAVEELAKIAGVEINELADAMFAAKSDLAGMDEKAILTMDSKIFDLGGKRLRISVLETTKPENALNLISSLKAKMTEMKAEEKLDGFFFYIIDIINSSAEVIVANDWEKEIIAKAHGVEFSGDTVTLPGVVSRKKQIVPNIEKVLTTIKN